MSISNQEFSPDLLRVYYGRLFPYEALFNWLSYGNDPRRELSAIDRTFFSRREFSFTIEDDIYIRYQSFKDIAELTEAIQKRQPHKIDIGAVFSIPPKEHNSVNPETFKTIERELVFDIDMTDYDDIRTCCSGANICLRCWPYMTMAIKVIDRVLREDFGFCNILWIYSGRRGVHCWVCDSSARELSNEARTAIVEYMSVDVQSLKKKNSMRHPMLQNAYSTLEPYFETFIADGALGQGLLESTESCIRVLNTLPNETVREELFSSWKKNATLSGAKKWKELKKATTTQSTNEFRENHSAKKRRLTTENCDQWRMELVFSHCYPRLDVNVSKAQNHLLKSPFCVHPKTGRVCVPIDPILAEQFNPFEVPTVRSLCEQVDSYDRGRDTDDADLPDIDKTDMKAALDCFERTFMNSLWSSIRRNFHKKTEEKLVLSGDF